MFSFESITNIIFDENPSLEDLFKLVAVLALCIYASFAALKPIVTYIAKGPLRPALVKAAEREYDPSSKILQVLNINNEEEFIDLSIDFFSMGMLTNTQHLIGGGCAIPALLANLNIIPINDTSITTSLACLGIMIEMGWEVQDMLTMAFYRLFTQVGKVKFPNAMIAVLIIHHSLATTLALPMILNYRGLPELHRLCFDLQFSGGAGGFIGEFSKLLDVSKPNELRRFQFLSFLMFLIFLWTRVFDWFYLMGIILYLFYREERWTFLGVGIVVFLVFSVFNVFICVIPTYQRLVKFMNMTAEYKVLPDDADEATRRSTIANLRKSAAVLSRTSTFNGQITEMMFVDRHVDSRQSISVASLPSTMKASASESTAAARHQDRQSMFAWKSLHDNGMATANKKMKET